MDEDFAYPYLDDEHINDLKPVEQELFETVYQWGHFGVVTDWTCPVFQNYIEQIKRQASDRPF